jgi:signal transduction histidine kinase
MSSTPQINSESILILAPTGQDATLIAEALRKGGIYSEIISPNKDLRERLNLPAGALIVAEEALSSQRFEELNQVLANQETWSDLPVILLTTHGESTGASLSTIKALWPSGNVILLERPFQAITLINAVIVALRSRRRQYQVRELLLKQIEATRLRDEFISIASHELKTPLTTLKLQFQLNQKLALTDESAAFSPERLRKLVRTAHYQVDRLGRLIEDMLDISRINSGKLRIEKSRVDLSELIHEIAERDMPQFEAVNSTLRIDAPKPVVGYWDRYRLEQVLSNLLNNALRYAPGSPVIVSAEDRGEQAVVRVKDSGAGIAPENQERIFQRFERAVSSGNISGLGLGLYICKEIVNRHSGSIDVESRPGAGATFIVQLPKTVPESA